MVADSSTLRDKEGVILPTPLWASLSIGVYTPKWIRGYRVVTRSLSRRCHPAFTSAPNPMSGRAVCLFRDSAAFTLAPCATSSFTASELPTPASRRSLRRCAAHTIQHVEFLATTHESTVIGLSGIRRGSLRYPCAGRFRGPCRQAAEETRHGGWSRSLWPPLHCGSRPSRESRR
jgi:hypothetical protein